MECGHAINRFSAGQCKALIAEAARQRHAVAMVYMSDGWGSFVTRQVVTKSDCGVRYNRTTKVRKEWVLQRCLVKSITPLGLISTRMGFSEPVPLEHGKTAAHYFQVLLGFVQPLRARVPSPTLHVYVLDGQVFSAIMTMAHGRRALFYSRDSSAPVHALERSEHFDQTDSHLWEVTDFILGLKCVSHSMSNGVKWGLQKLLSKEVLDNLFIGIKSAICHSTDLFDCIAEWAIANVRYEDPDWTAGEWSARQTLWNLLVSDGRMVDSIMEVLFDAAGGVNFGGGP